MRALVVISLLLSAGPAFAAAASDAIPSDLAQATVRIERLGSGSGRCGGVLVAPDLVATASHCIRNRPPTDLEIYVDGEPKRRAVAVVAQGEVINADRIQDYGRDWLLLKIEPVDNPPIAIADMTDALLKDLADRGEQVRVFSFAGGKLHALEPCGLFPNRFDGFFAMKCDIDHGDSGSPVVLMTPNGPRLLGVVSGFNKAGSYAASTSQFAHLVHP